MAREDAYRVEDLVVLLLIACLLVYLPFVAIVAERPELGQSVRWSVCNAHVEQRLTWYEESLCLTLSGQKLYVWPRFWQMSHLRSSDEHGFGR